MSSIYYCCFIVKYHKKRSVFTHLVRGNLTLSITPIWVRVVSPCPPGSNCRSPISLLNLYLWGDHYADPHSVIQWFLFWQVMPCFGCKMPLTPTFKTTKISSYCFLYQRVQKIQTLNFSAREPSCCELVHWWHLKFCIAELQKILLHSHFIHFSIGTPFSQHPMLKLNCNRMHRLSDGTPQPVWMN